jgi:hypothetical protein
VVGVWAVVDLGGRVVCGAEVTGSWSGWVELVVVRGWSTVVSAVPPRSPTGGPGPGPGG